MNKVLGNATHYLSTSQLGHGEMSKVLPEGKPKQQGDEDQNTALNHKRCSPSEACCFAKGMQSSYQKIILLHYRFYSAVKSQVSFLTEPEEHQGRVWSRLVFSGQESHQAICSHETDMRWSEGITAITSSKAPGGTKLAMTLYQENTGGCHLKHKFHKNSLKGRLWENWRQKRASTIII